MGKTSENRTSDDTCFRAQKLRPEELDLVLTNIRVFYRLFVNNDEYAFRMMTKGRVLMKQEELKAKLKPRNSTSVVSIVHQCAHDHAGEPGRP